MKKIILLLFAIIVIFVSCEQRTSTNPGNHARDYETMYKDSFDIILKEAEGMHDPHNLSDTLFAEMYIGVKTLYIDRETIREKSADIIIDRAEKLLKIDTTPDNLRKYLEAEQIVYGARKDKENSMRTQYRSFNTYPANSTDRLFSLANLFLVLGISDSTDYYFQKSLIAAEDECNSKDEKKRVLAIAIKVCCLVRQDRINEAQQFLLEAVETIRDEEIRREYKRMTPQQIYNKLCIENLEIYQNLFKEWEHEKSKKSSKRTL